jgi:hypothetical protein
MSPAIQTANGMYTYSQIVHGRKLMDWASLVHQTRLKQNKWKYSAPKLGSFHLDTLVMCVGDLHKEIQTLELRNTPENVEVAAYFVHLARQKTIKWWSEQSPWTLDPYTYFQPKQPIDANLSILKYSELPDNEKEWCRNIASIILDLMC